MTAYTRDLGHCSACCNVSIKSFLAVTNRAIEHYNSVDRGIWWKEIYEIVFRFSPLAKSLHQGKCVLHGMWQELCVYPFVIESLPDHRGLFQVLSLPQKAEEERREGQNLQKLRGKYLRHPLHPFPGLMNSVPLERWITSTCKGDKLSVLFVSLRPSQAFSFFFKSNLYMTAISSVRKKKRNYCFCPKRLN